MKNISYSSKINQYPQDDRLVGDYKKEYDEVTPDERVKLSLCNEIDVCDALLGSVEDLYKVRQHKELYDVQIYLRMASHLLKSIK